MSAVDDHTISRAIEIDAPIEVVWSTITEPDQIPRWFSDEADLVARPGASGTLTFRREGHDPLEVQLAIVAADRPTRFAFRWGHPAGTEATPETSVLVTFTLTEQGPARTLLEVTETGLEGMGWSAEETAQYVADHRHGWQVHGDRLRALFAGDA